MTRKQWILASALSGIAILGIIGLCFWQQSQEMEKLRRETQAVHGDADQATVRASALSNELAQVQSQVAALQQEKEAAVNAQKGIEDSMKSALESKDVTISQLQGRLTVNILDRILFDSGEASLRPEGENVLRQIAAVLSKFPRRQIHVVGHTDDVPIRLAARTRFASNWELSTARATAAVRFLCEQAEVDPKRLAAVGYGENHPLADNTTEEGKAKNRRIEVVVLPEELSKMLPMTGGVPAVLDHGETNAVHLNSQPSPTNAPGTAPGLAKPQPTEQGTNRP